MNNKTKGIICILFAAFSFTLMSVFIKLAGDLPAQEKAFFRNIFAFIIAFVIMRRQKIKFKIEKENILPLVLRALLGTIGMVCNFYAIDHLVIADANMLNKLSPFFTIIFSYIILKEDVKTIQWLAIIGAFIGSLFIIKPSFANAALFPSMIGLFGGISAGAAYSMLRLLGKKNVNRSFIVLFFSAFSSLITFPLMMLDYVPMTGNQWLIMALVAVSATGGQFGLTYAYYYAPAKEISIYDYSQIVFAAVFGFIIFNQKPDIYSFLGYLIISAMAMIMFFYNNGKLSFSKNHIKHNKI